MIKIGWIGLGNMGNPMSLNLVKAGYDVTVWNRTPSKADNLVAAGAKLAASPKEVAEQSDIIFTMVADGKIMQHVALDGATGIISGLDEGKTVIDMSTVAPQESEIVALALEHVGAEYLRAPVTGSTVLAENATLGILASGKKDVYEKMLPILQKLGSNHFYLGSAEEARVMKLALNTMIATTMQMEAEAVVLAEKAGLDVRQVCDIIANSAVGSPICNYKSAVIAEGEYPAAFSVKLMMKDLDLAFDAAKHYGVAMPVTSITRQQLASADATGRGDKDIAVLTQVLEESSGYKR